MLLYIHIPYCDSKCHYCSFNSYVDRFDTRTQYMQALHKQLSHELERFGATKNSIETLFIGGGTPSTVSPELYLPIFELLDGYLQDDAEITTEANPNSATLEWLSGMQNLGINRVSFGVQSFDDSKLKNLNRVHSSKQARESILDAKSLGFEHISMDLLYNYKSDTKKLLLSDIEQAFKLPIDHISAYELTIEDGTKFSTTPEVKQENEKLAFFVADEIKKRGFVQYEISNFGSYKSRHNMGYWKLKEYIGAGAGAVGFLSGVRYYPQNNIDNYINNPLNITTEELTADNILTESIFLGLRSCIGIDISTLTGTIKNRVDVLINERKLILRDNTIYNQNYFLADELTLFLLG